MVACIVAHLILVGHGHISTLTFFVSFQPSSFHHTTPLHCSCPSSGIWKAAWLCVQTCCATPRLQGAGQTNWATVGLCCQPPRLPTSQKDLLVHCTCPPHPLSNTKTTNELYWFIGVLHLLSPTRHWPPRPPMSYYDSLVCHPPPCPSSTTMTTNESLWLVCMSSSCSPPIVNHQDH